MKSDFKERKESKNSNMNIVHLPESFNIPATNFTLHPQGMGEVIVDFKRWSDGLIFHFGFHGYVSSTGYKSLFLYSQQLQEYQTPEEAAQFYALQLYETEGKEYQKKMRVQELNSSQLYLFKF